MNQSPMATDFQFAMVRIEPALILSQVILGMQLPFAVDPLLCFTICRQSLGVHASGRVTSIALWCVAATVVW